MATEAPPMVETLDPTAEQRQRAEELDAQLAKLRKREAATSRRIAEVDSRSAAIEQDADRVRFEREMGSTTGRAAQAALDTLHAESAKLAAERSELVRGQELRAPVVAELEAELAATRQALALVDVEPLLARERELWARAGEGLEALAATFDELVEHRTELEARRATLSPDVRAAVAGVQPWTPDLRSFVFLVTEIAVNRMRRDYGRAVGDVRVELIPDLTARLDEAHAFEGVESWRYIPG